MALAEVEQLVVGIAQAEPPAEGGAAFVGPRRWQDFVVRGNVIVDCQAELLEVVLISEANGRGPDFLHGGKQKTDQHRDDGDDHK